MSAGVLIQGNTVTAVNKFCILYIFLLISVAYLKICNYLNMQMLG